MHHSNEDDTIENNPWKIQSWYKDEKNEYPRNLEGDSAEQQKLTQLLSMFEVTFTAKQRKNYLFYTLLFLFTAKTIDIKSYRLFVSGLAEKYLRDVYLVESNLNEINTPKPGSFDTVVLKNGEIDRSIYNNMKDFSFVFGDGEKITKGIPLFIFNYLDYKLWELYADSIRGHANSEGSQERKNFFDTLGCSDFGLRLFDQFYFSRTRKTLEHYFPQANATSDKSIVNADQINCLGNYAMIGSEANSSGSNWSPRSKMDHYLDASGKIRQISVASIKFMIMMRKCKDNYTDDRDPGCEWNYEDIRAHQDKMLDVLLGVDRERSHI